MRHDVNKEHALGNLICMGKLGKAIGLQGWLNFWPECEQFALLKTCSVWVKKPNSDNEFFSVVVNSIQNNGQRILLDEISTRTKAEDLTHATLWIASKDLPELSKDEFYWEDLIGLSVQLAEGSEILGNIIGLTPTPAYDLLVIELNQMTLKNGQKSSERLIPFLPDIFIHCVDLEKKLIQLKPAAADFLVSS